MPGPYSTCPTPVTLENYLNIFSETPELLGYILNSFIVATTTTFVILTCGGLAAYSLGRLTYRGRNFILILILAVSMFPPLALLPSLFNMFLELRMINSYSGLIIGHAGLYTPIAIWILTNFFKTVPHEIEDAARVDGASSLRIFWSIILPLSAPGLISTGLIVFIFSWNEFPLSLVSDERQFHAHRAGGHLALPGRIFVSVGDHHRSDDADDPAYSGDIGGLSGSAHRRIDRRLGEIKATFQSCANLLKAPPNRKLRLQEQLGNYATYSFG